jgi:large subunit ribosomal protein L14
MIFMESKVYISDNSGGKIGKCIKVLKTKSAYGKKKFAGIGDFILVSIKEAIPKKKIKKGTLYNAIVLRTKKPMNRYFGSVKFNKNSVLLLDKQLVPIATRIFGVVPKELRESKNSKILSLVSSVF